MPSPKQWLRANAPVICLGAKISVCSDPRSPAAAPALLLLTSPSFCWRLEQSEDPGKGYQCDGRVGAERDRPRRDRRGRG